MPAANGPERYDAGAGYLPAAILFLMDWPQTAYQGFHGSAVYPMNLPVTDSTWPYSSGLSDLINEVLSPTPPSRLRNALTASSGPLSELRRSCTPRAKN